MKLSVYKKIFAHGKIKSGRKFFVKKKGKKKKQAEGRKDRYHSVEKLIKNSFVKAAGTGGKNSLSN